MPSWLIHWKYILPVQPGYPKVLSNISETFSHKKYSWIILYHQNWEFNSMPSSSGSALFYEDCFHWYTLLFFFFSRSRTLSDSPVPSQEYFSIYYNLHSVTVLNKDICTRTKLLKCQTRIHLFTIKNIRNAHFWSKTLSNNHISEGNHNP